MYIRAARLSTYAIMDVRDMPPYNGEREKEKEVNFDPARQVKAMGTDGKTGILYKSWVSEVARKADEEERQQPWLKNRRC